MMFAPVIMIFRKMILNTLIKGNARTEYTAMTLRDAGILTPATFRGLTETMVSQGVIGKTDDERYYVL